MTNCPFVKLSGVLNDYVSDHYTVFCIRKKEKENKECSIKTSRQYKNYNHDDFSKLLRSKNWLEYDTMQDLDRQWQFIKDSALEILSIMCPYKTIHVRKVPTPWITPDIYKMIKEKRDLVKTYKTYSQQDILKQLRILRNKLNTRIDKAKASYIENKLHLYGKHPKRFWRIINDMIKQDSLSDVSNIDFKDSMGNNVSKENIPNLFNNFFETMAEKTSNSTKVIYENRNVNVNVNLILNRLLYWSWNLLQRNLMMICLVVSKD